MSPVPHIWFMYCYLQVELPLYQIFKVYMYVCKPRLYPMLQLHVHLIVLVLQASECDSDTKLYLPFFHGNAHSILPSGQTKQTRELADKFGS